MNPDKFSKPINRDASDFFSNGEKGKSCEKVEDALKCAAHIIQGEKSSRYARMALEAGAQYVMTIEIRKDLKPGFSLKLSSRMQERPRTVFISDELL